MKLPEITEENASKIIAISLFVLVTGLLGGGVVWLLIHSFTPFSFLQCLALYYAVQVPLNINKIIDKYREEIEGLYERHE